jgi:crotonobetainyl-CoA:carnitine CoA-transferase CaiB-like acyl-CoA transferase
MNHQALSGLKVVEYSEFVSGPYCGRLLTGLGAEVIKVEKPGPGDKARSWGPFPQDLPHPEKSGLFLFLNVNKLGVTLNIESVVGVKLFKELVKWADVLIESNPPMEMTRLGLDYDSLFVLNPSLIMTSITPFGQSGPYRDYKGCDLVNTHMSGEAFGNPAEGVDNVEEDAPLKTPAHTGDFMTGLSAAVCTMSAVFARLATGLGQHIDLSQQEALASVGRQELAFYLCEGTPHTRQKGRKRRGGILYRCKDGYVCIWAGPFLKTLVEMIGSPDWANTELFQNPTLLSQYMDEFNRLVETWTMEHTTEEINQAAVAHGVPCSPVRTVEELVNDEQLAFRDFFMEIDHPVAGRLKYPGAPYKLSATPWKIERPAPLLSEHNEKVYCQMLGYNNQDLVRMRQAGAI